MKSVLVTLHEYSAHQRRLASGASGLSEGLTSDQKVLGAGGLTQTAGLFACGLGDSGDEVAVFEEMLYRLKY